MRYGGELRDVALKKFDARIRASHCKTATKLSPYAQIIRGKLSRRIRNGIHKCAADLERYGGTTGTHLEGRAFLIGRQLGQVASETGEGALFWGFRHN